MTVLRTFVALWLDEPARQALAGLQRELAGELRGLRWVEPAQLHLTLRFLGDTPADRLPGLQEALAFAAAASRALRFTVQGAGAFPGPARPRVLWAGVRGGEDLAGLRRRVEEAVRGLGWPAENRPFRAHVTLARARDGGVAGDVAGALARRAGRTWGTVEAGALVLVRSTLTPAGPVYAPLASFPLGGGA